MADALRGTAPLKGFADALSVHLVEVCFAELSQTIGSPQAC